MITLAIADDQSLIRNMIKEKISAAGDIKIIAETSNGEALLQYLEQCAPSELPQIVLIDIEMPVMDGIRTVSIASVKYPSVKFIILTVFDNTDKIFEAIRAGASGYLLKDDDSITLKEAIINVIEYNGVPMSPAIARKTLALLKGGIDEKQPLDGSLSTREQEVLLLLVDGLDHREIAEKLFISSATVRTHIANIYQKLHVRSKAEAIKMAYRNRWV